MENKDMERKSCINELVTTIQTSKSLDIVQNISKTMVGNTFHHHFHLLYDLRTRLGDSKKIYTEIGTFHGGSACLMLQHPFDTEIHCIDPCAVTLNQYEILQQNITKFNNHKRQVKIHRNYSTDKQFIEKLHKEGFRTDILFIDGDNTATGTRNDFDLFHCFVNPGGYIVFDDYMDNVYTPAVHSTVDDIVKHIEKYSLPYTVIGSIENYKNAYTCVPMCTSNEFILKKKESTDIPFAICMATYDRANGKSKQYLEKCLGALVNQNYQNFKVFIVGDKYENEAEFLELVKIIPAEKLYFENLKVAVERENIQDKYSRWKVGGVTAMNRAVQVATEQNFKYILHADDDDFWDLTRLSVLNETIKRFPDAIFLYHYSTHPVRVKLPKENLQPEQIYYNNLIPRASNAVHATFCINYSMIESFFMKTFDPQNPTAVHYLKCGDEQKIDKVVSMIQQYPSMYVLFIPMLLCFKDEEAEANK